MAAAGGPPPRLGGGTGLRAASHLRQGSRRGLAGLSTAASDRLQLEAGSPVLALARAAAQAGGRVLVVGGWVRDRLLGREPRDVDLEVHGFDETGLAALLEPFAPVKRVGRDFSIHLVSGTDPVLSVSLPRGGGLTGVEGGATGDPAFARAACYRDLRVDSMGWDPITGRLLDPHGGARDLERRVLRATDPRHFGDDPLRALRVAVLAARLDMQPDPPLRALCAQQDLSGVAPERIFEELRKLLLESQRPSAGLELMREMQLLRFFPSLEALIDVPQDPRWHPEGNVWVHTSMVVDQAAGLRAACLQPLALMFAALCHDLGKPDATTTSEGRVSAHGHEVRSAELAAAWLAELRASAQLGRAVASLVLHHLAPLQLVRQDAGRRAYRRLDRRLRGAGVDAELLECLARADQLGRGNALRFGAGAVFLERMRRYVQAGRGAADAVTGRQVIARGIAPGPRLGPILARCRDLQDETGWTDPQRILDRVLRSEED